MTHDRSRILVIDDERNLRRAVEMGLRQHGFDVDSAADGHEAIERIVARRPDAIVLDIGLPGTDGFALLPRIREHSDAPVLMLTARTELDDRVFALDAGADDYLAKPFEMDELRARLHAHLRRRPAREGMLVYADVVLDQRAHCAWRADHDLALSPREFELLMALMREQGRVFRREQLLQRVWGDCAEVGSETVDRFVSLLRAKLEAYGERLVQTVRGVGYVLRCEPAT